MEFPFQTSADRQAQIDRLFKQINQQAAAIDQLVSRVEQVEGKCQQLYEYTLTSQKKVFRSLITELYNFRVVDVYRAFFSRDYFMSSAQQALGYWHYVCEQQADKDIIRKFVVVYLSKIINDFLIAKGNIANYLQSVNERVNVEVRLTFPEEKLSSFDDFDKVIEDKHHTLNYERTDKNNELYVNLWQQMEPLLQPISDVDLLNEGIQERIFTPDNISKLTNSIESILTANGIAVYYSPSEFPAGMEMGQYFIDVDEYFEQMPLIIRKEDKYLYVKGCVNWNQT